MPGRGKKKSAAAAAPTAVPEPAPAAESSNVTLSINKTIVEDLKKAISKLLQNSSAPSSVIQQEEVDSTDISGVFTLLLQAITTLTIHASNTPAPLDTSSEDKKAQENSQRVQVDELDECRQRSMKGNLIVTSPSLPGKSKVTLIKTDTQLSEESLSLTNHMISLVKTKLAVDLPPEDIQACHRLSNGSVLLCIWNRKIGSAWSQMVDRIKMGKNSDINIYFNFQLTKKRSNLLYVVRNLRKSNEISKYYTDENGYITVMVKKKEDGGEKLKVTYNVMKKGEEPKTLREAELLDIISKSRSWAEQS